MWLPCLKAFAATVETSKVRHAYRRAEDLYQSRGPHLHKIQATFSGLIDSGPSSELPWKGSKPLVEGGFTRCIPKRTTSTASGSHSTKRDESEANARFAEKLKGKKLEAFAADRARQELEEDDEAAKIVATMFSHKCGTV